MHSTRHAVASLLALALLCNLQSVACIQCHVCSTKTAGQEDCLGIEAGSEKYLRGCESPYNVTCRVVEQYVDFDILEKVHDKHVIRQCGAAPHNPEEPCYYRTGYGGRMSVCNCDGDGCNGAGRLWTSTVALAVGSLLVAAIL